MPLQLMICRLCSRSRPDFLQAVGQVAQEYPQELELVELECMAACDDVPAAMLETDYHPQLAPCELLRIVRERMAAEAR